MPPTPLISSELVRALRRTLFTHNVISDNQSGSNYGVFEWTPTDNFSPLGLEPYGRLFGKAYSTNLGLSQSIRANTHPAQKMRGLSSILMLLELEARPQVGNAMA